MISEVLNALLITYLATEYSAASQQHSTALRDFRRDWWKQPRYTVPCVVVAVVNAMERLSLVGAWAQGVLHQFLHVPKVLLAAASFVVALYYDCRRIQSNLDVADFAKHVGWAFLYVLPVYPFLAVLISVGFLFVINIFEFFHWNEQLLNWPIYYGVLYGPLSFVYWRVKEKILQERTTLPSVGRVLGSSL